MKACIVLNGEVKELSFISENIAENKYDYLICADGGANHLYNLNLVPDYILGDLDSINKPMISYYKEKGTKFKEFPKRKDETDTQLCIHLAKELGVSEIHLVGALGGRIDHTIANINLMYYIRELGIKPVIKNSSEDIYIAKDEEIKIKGNCKDTISILPIKGDAKGITLKDLEYPLNNATIKYGDPIGISNVMKRDRFTVKIDNGSVVIIRNKKVV